MATAGQCEIDMKFKDLVTMGDQMMWYKYIIKNVARRHGKTATFMPKPIFEDNGSGMHTHFSLWKGGQPLFAGEKYAGMTDMALNAIGGVLKHARAILAFCRPDDELVQTARARVRSAGQSGHVAAQPLGVGPHSDVLVEPKSEAIRIPLPGSERQSVPDVHGDPDGRSRRNSEQDSTG